MTQRTQLVRIKRRKSQVLIKLWIDSTKASNNTKVPGFQMRRGNNGNLNTVDARLKLRKEPRGRKTLESTANNQSDNHQV